MPKKKHLFMNRELSWLHFNQRVLDEAANCDNALMDRLFMLTVTASNLDEFYMVRVGGLDLLRRASVRKRDISGLTPVQQLGEISKRVKKMTEEQYALLSGEVLPTLSEAGIEVLARADLNPIQQKGLREAFLNEVLPTLTPMPLDNCNTFPLLHNMEIYVLAELGVDEKQPNQCRFSAIPLGSALNHLWPIASDDSHHAFVLLEDLVINNIGALFHGRKVLRAAPFRVTRNADMSVDEDFTDDLSREMEQILEMRRTSGCVRLEVRTDMPSEGLAFLRKALDVQGQNIIKSSGPIDLTRLRPLMSLEGYPKLHGPSWPPRPPSSVKPKESIFPQIRDRDILLSHPFESFDPVVRFVSEAADDPDVLAIKQILYRTSPKSPIIQALRRAAENGKYVTAVVEIKARFDEANNIAWARELENIGVQVIYGIRNLKTHGKICIVVRREPEGIRRYVHFGTGNYNDRTACLYTDVGLLTCDPDLGHDASAFFNAICGQSLPRPYRRLKQSPIDVRSHLIGLIDNEVARKKQGQPARIIAKMNSLADPELISALYRASQAGVQIELNVRGICGLLPGVKGLSDNIRVISIIDRFLEHSRIFYFHHGGQKLMFISSADWMPRNMDKRIELLVPVTDPACKRKLMQILTTCLADNVKGREILSDGSYGPCDRATRAKVIRAQEELYRLAKDASSARNRSAAFETHRPPK